MAMIVKKIFTQDLQIAKSLINKDEMVTRKYLYQQCYPLFKSIYDNYYTDCANCKEFIDEIYIVVLAPSKATGKCQMENFRGESTLTSWLKTACLFYCYKQFEIKGKMPKHEQISYSNITSNPQPIGFSGILLAKRQKIILLYIILAQQKRRRHKIPLPHKAT